jgi:hypothetical protein
MKYIPPEPLKASFTCPHCGSIAQQAWWTCTWSSGSSTRGTQQDEIKVGRCTHCNKRSLWVEGRMLYPETGTAPFPNPEMPAQVKKLYEEAASIQSKSPRGAGALLRLGIQVLCAELGEKGKNINDDIKSLVAKGLPVMVQQSVDVVRVTGNDAVHPGQINTDDPEVVGRLFDLTNIIVEYMIAMPKKVSGLYNNLPGSAVAGISKRDGS